MKNLTIASIVALTVLGFTLLSTMAVAIGSAFTYTTTQPAPRSQPRAPAPRTERLDTYETTWPIMPNATIDGLTDELVTLLGNLSEAAVDVELTLTPLSDGAPGGTFVIATDASRNAIRTKVVELFE